ncbi:MAG: hypothetical protein Q9217_004118 [Psora testacea]
MGLRDTLFKRYIPVYSPIHQVLQTDSKRLGRAPPPRPTISPLSKAQKASRRPFYIASGLFVYGVTAYSYWFYSSIIQPMNAGVAPESSDPNALPPNTDVSDRYDASAPTFDSEVGYTEAVTGLNILRRKLVKQAKGHVLEVSVGTGRNAKYYDLRSCNSITFLDRSGSMVKIAQEKWQKLHPSGAPRTKVAWRTQDVMEPFPAPREGFDTIVQTMGVCSTPDPASTLRRLGTLLNPATGRILLLEHGRGKYQWINWVLDRNAARHADRFGCWFNRDIGKVLEESGLVIEKCERPYWWNLGTMWVVEARANGWEKGSKKS